MQFTTVALLASAGFAAALPQFANSDDCWTSTICTDSYPTEVNVVTDVITSTSVTSHFNPVTVTTSTPSSVVYPVYVTHTSESTSYWNVTTQVRRPYTTSRVITVPVHTFSLEDVCDEQSTVLYPINVVTNNATSTTFMPAYVTSSTPCYETAYPVSTSLRTNIITRTVQSCATITHGHGDTSIISGVTLSTPTTTSSILSGVTLSTGTTSILSGVTLSTGTTSILSGVTLSTGTTSILSGVTLSTPTTTTILTGVTLSSPTSTTTIA